MYKYKKTHNCGELNKSHVGEQVTLTGWVQRQRDLGGVVFITLRDRSGIVQITVNGETKTNVFSLDFWHNCLFASDYTVVTKAEGNKATVTIKANKFAKSVFISLPENYKYDYSDNYLDIEAGQEKTVVISSRDQIDESEIMVTDFAKASNLDEKWKF